MPRTKNNVELFLDSGAFSAFTQGVEIDIDEYIQFIKDHEDLIAVYANLDAIGDPVKTLKNQAYMESKGLSPMPCFHYGEDEEYLCQYLIGYNYIALGGMVPISTKDLIPWLDRIFSKYICDKDGMPTVQIHGFGLTSLPLMLRYPWYSVDSTSWVMTGRMGGVYVPRLRRGEWIYDEQSWKVMVSTRSPVKKDAGKHIDSFTPAEHQLINTYFEEKGFQLGESYFVIESTDYELKDDEKWADKAKGDRRAVEVIVDPGLCNDYKQRDELNILYFIDLEASLPEWPWGFKRKNVTKGFGLT